MSAFKPEELDEIIRIAKVVVTARKNSGKWFVVGPPWGNGTYVVSGNQDPHGAMFVADCEPLLRDEESDDLDPRLVADHVASACPNTVIRLAEVAKRVSDLRIDDDDLARLRGLWLDCTASSALTSVSSSLAAAMRGRADLISRIYEMATGRPLGDPAADVATPAAPPESVIEAALAQARLSPCRSKRGVVLFDPRTGGIFGTGHNGPPSPRSCPGREHCAGNCGQRSVHAEARALQTADSKKRPLDLVHVELAPVGGVALVCGPTCLPCGGPTCLPCAALIQDADFVDHVWLYEESVRRCLACKKFEDSSLHVHERLKRCETCGADLVPVVAWRRYTSAEFYRRTLENLGLKP